MATGQFDDYEDLKPSDFRDVKKEKPAAPAGFTHEAATAHAQMNSVAFMDAAPSVAPEPPTREALAEIVRSHLTSTYHCTRVWEAWHVGTMTEDDFEPASESDMAEDIADAILANHPPRAPLTEEHVTAVVRSVCPNLAETSKAWRDLVVECRYWLEAAHGIGGK